MSRWINVALVAMALGLAGQAAEEAAAPEAAPAPVAAPAPLPLPATKPVAARELAGTVVARPLFSPGRRPATPPMAAPAPSPADAPLPRLAGVSGGPWPRAILVRPAGRTAVLAVGETLDGRVLRAIGPDSIVLEGPEGRRVLSLAADEAIERTAMAATGPPHPGAPAPDAAPPGLPPGDPSLIALPSDGDGRVRAVLASADAMASAPTSGDCCVPDLGWSRVRRGTSSTAVDAR